MGTRGQIPWNKGKRTSETTRLAQSLAQKGKSKPRISIEEEQIRQEAKSRGEGYYLFPGRLCSQNHVGARRRVYNTECEQCHVANSKARQKVRAVTEPEFVLYESARANARKCRVPFSLTVAYVKSIWPLDGKCPILGIPLERRVGHPGPQRQSPSLDRLEPSKGYVPGNVAVISYKANLLKNNETDPAVFERLAAWLRKQQEVANGVGA